MTCFIHLMYPSNGIWANGVLCVLSYTMSPMKENISTCVRCLLNHMKWVQHQTANLSPCLNLLRIRNCDMLWNFRSRSLNWAWAFEVELTAANTLGYTVSIWNSCLMNHANSVGNVLWRLWKCLFPNSTEQWVMSTDQWALIDEQKALKQCETLESKIANCHCLP